jgi:hypothetical protein
MKHDETEGQLTTHEHKWPGTTKQRRVGLEVNSYKPLDHPTAGPAVTRRMTAGGGNISPGTQSPRGHNFNNVKSELATNHPHLDRGRKKGR